MTEQKVAVVAADVLGTRMAGPAIRAVELATTLASEHDVRLASTVAADAKVRGIPAVVLKSHREARALESWADVIVMQGGLFREFPFLLRSRKRLVADLYDPFHLEQLHHVANSSRRDARVIQDAVRTLDQQISKCDFFICASERQRDFWMGHLAAAGRTNPFNYGADPSLRNLIEVVPFGVPDEPAVRGSGLIRGQIPGIDPGDAVVLWAGGLYPWLDPFTVVRAVELARRAIPRIRLVFPGARHPNPEVPEMPTVEETRRLAADLGLLGTHVFFTSEWIEYDKRQDFLLDADVGVTAHFDHVETRYSFRTRVLDYFWAGLPIVSTGGDILADVVEQEGAGAVVAAGDAQAFAAALQRLLEDADWRTECRSRSWDTGQRYRWSVVARPLVRYCRDGQTAPDIERTRGVVRLVAGRRIRHQASAIPIFRYASRLRDTLSEPGGWADALHKAARKLRRAGRLFAPLDRRR